MAYAARYSWLFRLGIALLIVAAVLLIWLSNLYFTQVYSQQTRDTAEGQIALYSGRINAELQRANVVPLLLSRDTRLLAALNSGDFTDSSQRLISYQTELGLATIMMLTPDGRVVASSDRRDIGGNFREEAYFIDALRSNDTVFSTDTEERVSRFFFSRALKSERTTVGVIVVKADLDNLFSQWSSNAAEIIVTNTIGQIILSTEQSFIGRTVEDALRATPGESIFDRAVQATGEWTPQGPSADGYIRNIPVYRLDAQLGFRGWTLSYLSAFNAVRERVNTILALEITALALCAAGIFYYTSRRARRESLELRAESSELRALNDQLSREIAERHRVEQSLKMAEQTLAQSSKLAALGEMSAAVSHELNQPLAAMRTYLAGAKLLLERARPDEALSSFGRIDDLIERMGTITKQLKGYARTGTEDLIPIDMRDCLSSSLSMMTPQLEQMDVEILKTVPRIPVMVRGDTVRIEQVIVNLLRNALDAIASEPEKTLEILLLPGDPVTLTVRDNGQGISDFENLFEPFFTTKEPGAGVGLGLAISSGIAADLGGRLIARNAEPTGAVFEFQLPGLTSDTLEAAE
ncbi:MAG: ATP-binding protein [Pseudomonadota bacterium]